MNKNVADYNYNVAYYVCHCILNFPYISFFKNRQCNMHFTSIPVQTLAKVLLCRKVNNHTADVQCLASLERLKSSKLSKNGFKSVIFYCSVSIGNISLLLQTFILPLIVIIQWDFCLHKESDNSQCSTQRSDLIIIQFVWNDMKKQNKLRQTKARRTVAMSPRCFKKPTCKADLKPFF